MTDLQNRRTFLGTLSAFSAVTFFEPSYRTGAALAEELSPPQKARVKPEVVDKTLHAMCKVLIPSDLGSVPGEKASPKVGSGVLIQTPEALADIVGPDGMVVLTVAHNFMDTPHAAKLTLEFFTGQVTGISPSATVPARLLASDRHFNSSDDVAFLVVDIPNDPLLAARLKGRALALETSTTLPQFTPVCSVGFSAGKCLALDDLRLLDTPKQLSGKAALLLTGSVKPGHSGSPLVNNEGRVIGVVSGTHETPRSIAAGEPLDFMPKWEIFSSSSGTPAEIEGAIRRHDLQRIPHDVQHSKNRILGPAVHAISTFASAVEKRFNLSLSEFEHILESKRRLAAAVTSSNLPGENKVKIINDLQGALTESARELFIHVGGTPRAIAEKIRRFGE
jgi:hypothetical protein